VDAVVEVYTLGLGSKLVFTGKLAQLGEYVLIPEPQKWRQPILRLVVDCRSGSTKVIASVFMAVPTGVTAVIKAVTCEGQSDTGVARFKMLFIVST
jgi:hypothetical protein